MLTLCPPPARNPIENPRCARRFSRASEERHYESRMEQRMPPGRAGFLYLLHLEVDNEHSLIRGKVDMHCETHVILFER
jgi:hypothetical protein